MKSKITIGLAISRNYNVVKLDMLEEEIEYNTTEEFQANVRKKFGILREEVNLEFTKIIK